MNYVEALAYIEQLNGRGIALGLERMQALLEQLGHPQKNLRCIHVAGTNGKGSVCALMDSALQKAGLRVGRYISPTLYAYRERIQINGCWIGEAELAGLLTVVKRACDSMAEQNLEQPTVFEVETAVAFLYFQQKSCDYVLLEVGMGGRLDSTNVIAKPVLTVITAIGMDHTAMLGHTLAAIAGEKGGIIKPGSPVVIGPQQAEAMAVLQQRCVDCGVVPVLTEPDQLQILQWSTAGQQFHYRTWREIAIGLLGDYQCINAAIALDCLQILQQQERLLTDAAVRDGLRQAKWPGRFELIHQQPLFFVDGAHNPAGAQALAETLQKHFANRKIFLLMAVFRDKDYLEIARIMSRCSDHIYCFQPKQERGLQADVLSAAVQPFYQHVVTENSAEQAVQLALQQAGDDDIIVSFGSLSTIKAVQDAVRQWEVQHGTSDEAH